MTPELAGNDDLAPVMSFPDDTTGMARLCERAWELFDAARINDEDVVPAASGPVLFFGDLPAYRASKIRVITVGLNPSLAEFPTATPWCRFPGLDRPDSYLTALSAYFRTDPYRRWFRCYEPMLLALGTSYYPGASNTALHTDLLTPVPTDPTWSGLSRTTRQRLGSDGKQLWKALVDELRPHVVLISVAKEHLRSLDLSTPWYQLHVIDRTNPYVVEAAELRLPTHPLVVSGRASQTPFGAVSSADKATIARRILEVL